MIALMTRLFARFTSYSPDFMDYQKEQEEAALSSAMKIKKSNALERELLARRKPHE